MEIVEYNSIVNAFYSCFFSGCLIQIEQISPFLNKLGDTDRLNAKIILRTVKIYPRFLFVGFYFKEDCVFYRSIAHNDFLQIPEIGFSGITIEILTVIVRNRKIITQ